AASRSSSAATQPASAAFPEAGFYVLRRADRYLIASCGAPGPLRGHAHNDALGFELAAWGHAFIVDAGSYVYTASAQWRNRVRATAAHNVVQLDGAEINRFEHDQLFALGSDARPQVLSWRSDGELDELVAQHDGYTRLAGVGVHRRRFVFRKR